MAATPESFTRPDRRRRPAKPASTAALRPRPREAPRVARPRSPLCGSDADAGRCACLSPAVPSAVGGQAGDRLAERKGVDLFGALVRQHGLEVVGVPDDRVLKRHAVRAEDRPGFPGDVDGGPDVAHLAEADLLRRDLPGFLEFAEVEREQLSPLQVSEHPGELALGELEAADLPAELLPRPGVVGSRLEAGP